MSAPQEAENLNQNSYKKMKSLIFSCIESRIEEDQVIYGCFKLGPFHFNQGITIGNSLRRILLSNLEGLAIAFVKIDGVKHEYSIINGIQESILEILINLKQIRFKTNRLLYKPQIAYLNIQGPTVVYSKDIELPSQIECVNPFQYIATLACDGKLKVKFFICQGIRYCLQSSIKKIVHEQFGPILNIQKNDFLFLDPIFVPVTKVNFIIENNQYLHCEFLIFEIWTKGSVHPKQSLYKAINELIKILLPFYQYQTIDIWHKLTIPRNNGLFQSKKFSSNSHRSLNKIKMSPSQFYKKILTLEISNLNLSLKTYLVLKKNNINTIFDLINQLKKYSALFNPVELSILIKLKNKILHN